MTTEAPSDDHVADHEDQRDGGQHEGRDHGDGGDPVADEAGALDGADPHVGGDREPLVDRGSGAVVGGGHAAPFRRRSNTPTTLRDKTLITIVITKRVTPRPMRAAR